MVHELLLRLDRNRIAKNASVLVFGQFASYALGVFYIAALARYVGAEGIGRISIANSINSLLILVVAPGLTTVLIRDVAADHKRAAAYITNMLFIRLLLGIPFALLTSLVAHVAGYSGETVTIIRIYSLAYLLDSLGQIVIAAFQAFERMEFEAASNVIQTSINVVLSLLAIYLRGSLTTIVIISVIAQAAKLLFVLVILRARFVQIRLAMSWLQSRSLFMVSLPFGILLALFAAKAQTATLVLSFFRGEEEVGIYSAANTLLGILLFVPTALSAAVFPAFSSLAVHSRQDLRSFYQLCFKYLLVLGFPLGMMTLLVGGRVLSLIFGGKFDASVNVLNVLALFLFTIVGYCNGPLLKAVGRQRFLVWTESLAVLTNAMLCVLTVPRWGPSGAAIAFVVSGIGTFIVHSAAAHRLLGLPLPWLTAGKILGATLFMGLVVFVSLWLGVPWPIAAVLLAPVAFGCLALLLAIIRRDELRTLAGASHAYSRAGTNPIGRPSEMTEVIP